MTMMKNQNEIKKEINDMSDRISNCVVNGFTVTIRPTKDGVKITSHKEKAVKLKY